MILEILVNELIYVGLLLIMTALFIYKYQYDKMRYINRAIWIKFKEFEYYNELKDEELEDFERTIDEQECQIWTSY